ncbi:MAG: 2-amino-4-hydroxy-6-hydroxymethyldihydropteridine diphosphokinase [Candidatus Peregrinibacteria bacterium]|nr:2-amino-4-hydroxy-6-hydroxymethyldihydropteridine diphosphokinase [Candidatus Peregrinibacteria bacterium]
MSETAYLSLGSNIDDRMAHMAEAESMLNAHEGITISKTSQVYETEPWPNEHHPDDHPHKEGGKKWFLNQVIQIETELSPQQLLEATQAIEKQMGRTQKHDWAPREIDIDILLYADQIIDEPDLEIPHRHMEDRQFILVPLLEIDPDLIDPMTGRPFKEILEEVKKKDSHKVSSFL